MEKLELKLIVTFPRYWIYRQFTSTLIKDRNIRTCEGSGLFYYISFCALISYQTSPSYRPINAWVLTTVPKRNISWVRLEHMKLEFGHIRPKGVF